MKGSVLNIDTDGGLGKGWGVARKLRVQYPWAIYHLMNRGDRREPIFKDDAPGALPGDLGPVLH